MAYNKYVFSSFPIIIIIFITNIDKVIGTLNNTKNISTEMSINNISDVQYNQKDELRSLKLLIKEQQENVLAFSSDIQGQIKVIRNATMFLITIISTKGKDCPGIRDTASKLRILYTALALQDPDIRINIPEEILQSLPEGPLPEDNYDYVNPDYYDTTTPNYELIATSDYINYSDSTEYTNIDDIETKFEELEGPCSNFSDQNISCISIPEESEIMTEVTTETNAEIETKESLDTEISTSLVTENYANTEIRSINGQNKYYPEDFYEIRKSSNIRSAFRCPHVSKKIGNECFSLHIDHHMNWTSARSFCRSLGGDLAEPDLRNNRLPKLLLKSWPSLRSSEYWTLWVGATDIEKEGEWHWVTGGILDLEASSRWDLVEPPSEGDTQDCLAMILWVPGRWRRWDLLDDQCDLKWAVFCEYSKLF